MLAASLKLHHYADKKMANREELIVIRAARAGQATAQLALGKRYLFGGAGLPKSETTALYWLDRAAQQQEVEAWVLIGSHIPFEAAAKSAQPEQLCIWYERAFDSGVLQAGLVLAKLVLAQAEGGTSEPLRRKAWMALESVAHAGVGEAQWLMAQLIGQFNASKAAGKITSATNLSGSASPSSSTGSTNIVSTEAEHIFFSPLMKLPSSSRAEQAILDWTTRAAGRGVTKAQLSLAERAWQAGDHAEFMQWAIPLSRELIANRPSKTNKDPTPTVCAEQMSVLARCANLMLSNETSDRAELEQFLEAAAEAGDKQSCLTLGLLHARMDACGVRLADGGGLANYKKALRWLSAAAESGNAEAWFAISRIYSKPEFSQRNVSNAMRNLRKAADSGYGLAQYELGANAWRARRIDPNKDIEALLWLRKAKLNGNHEAAALIQKIVEVPAPAPWAIDALQQIKRRENTVSPLLKARVELAIEFGLSRAEALLLDLNQADCGHCFVVDIRAIHPRSRRRLMLLDKNEQRFLLNRIVQLFDGVDGTMQGPEGNYRQRLYRLRMLTGAASSVTDLAA